MSNSSIGPIDVVLLEFQPGGLRDQGILTDEEFEAQKARVLAQGF